jgi:hypothetical protein
MAIHIRRREAFISALLGGATTARAQIALPSYLPLSP